jgi:oligoendopeptidase F
MRLSQNSLNFGTSLATAEVASTFFEDFVLQEILNTATPQLKLAILVKKLEDDVSTIFRQIAFYSFETELHTQFRQKGYLSKVEIGELFAKNVQAYLGPIVTLDPDHHNWWIYVSHFRSFFYVYSYASGLLISKSLQGMVKKDPAAIAQVKQFLSAGTSQSPAEIFRGLGIDVTNPTFWSQGLDEISALLTETETLAKTILN